MPPSSLHMTVLEITHSKTSAEIASLIEKLTPQIPAIVNYTSSQSPTHRARLIKPLLSFDASALALSFVPAASSEDAFSYHHLRRDVFAMCASAGVKVDSRYVVPSAHLTIGRFVQTGNFGSEDGSIDAGWVRALVEVIERVNEELKREYWSAPDREGGEWVVGKGKGMDLRMGTVWYGGGESVMVGEGF